MVQKRDTKCTARGMLGFSSSLRVKLAVPRGAQKRGAVPCMPPQHTHPSLDTSTHPPQPLGASEEVGKPERILQVLFQNAMRFLSFFFFSFSVFLTLPKYQINIRFEEVTAEHSSLPARRAAGCAGSLPRSPFTPRTPRAPFQQEKTGDFIAC